jgi:hypothetical protein
MGTELRDSIGAQRERGDGALVAAAPALAVPALLCHHFDQ